MNPSHRQTRRDFLKSTALGSVMALGWPQRAVWAIDSPDATAQPLRIVYFTDIHTRVEWDTPEALRLASDAMNQHHADLILCGGDMITDGYNGTSASVAPRWDAYLDMHYRLVPTPHVIIGNHDLVGVEPENGSEPEADPRSDVRRRLGIEKTYRSFDHAGYHFILLDVVQVTRDALKYRGIVDDAQMAWLKDDLVGVRPETPIILMSHMPLLTSFFQRTDSITAAVPENRGVVNNREVLEVFSGHRLLLVLQGHLHVNEMLRWGDTTFITGGAVCGKWWRGTWHGTQEGYGVLDIRADQVEWTYHSYGWTARRPAGV